MIFFHAVSVHGEEDVSGPNNCVLQGRLKNSEQLDVLDRFLTHLPTDRPGGLIQFSSFVF